MVSKKLNVKRCYVQTCRMKVNNKVPFLLLLLSTGVKYPFYGLQWHPEKAAFEWHPEKDTRHSWDAIRLGQYFANFFVNEARKNNNTFGSYEEELKWVIAKHQPTFTGYMTKSKTPFDQIYVF